MQLTDVRKEGEERNERDVIIVVPDDKQTIDLRGAMSDINTAGPSTRLSSLLSPPCLSPPRLGNREAR